MALLALTALLSLGAEEGAERTGGKPWVGQYIYARELTTRPERRAFWAEMETYDTYEEQLAHWRRHTLKMRQRAKDRGLSLLEPPEVMPVQELGGWRLPIYGLHLLSAEEIEEYRAKERKLTRAQGEAFRAAHASWMKRRSDLRGIPLKPTKAELDAMERAKKRETPEP